MFPISSLAEKTPAETARTVRVGYYENEVFEEGAEDGAVKTGYAYEYYRRSRSIRDGTMSMYTEVLASFTICCFPVI